MSHMATVFTLLAFVGFVLAETPQVDPARFDESPSRTDYFPVPLGDAPTIYEQPPAIHATAYPNVREDVRKYKRDPGSSDEANYFPMPLGLTPPVYEEPPAEDAAVYTYDNVNSPSEEGKESRKKEQDKEEIDRVFSPHSIDYFPIPLRNEPSVYMQPPPADVSTYTYYEVIPISDNNRQSPKKVDNEEVVGKLNRFRRTAYSDGGSGSSSSSQASSQSSSSSQGGNSGFGGLGSSGGIGDSPLGLSNSGAGSGSSSFASSQAGSSSGFNFPALHGFTGGYGGPELYNGGYGGSHLHNGGYPGYGGGFGGFPGGFGGFPSFSGSSSSASSNSAGFPGSLQGFGGPGLGFNSLPSVGGNSVGYGGSGGLDLLSRSGPGLVVPSVASGGGKGVFVSSSSNVDKDGKVSYKVQSGRF